MPASRPTSRGWCAGSTWASAEFPTFRDTVTSTTWCSGIGGRWAERRVRIVGDRGGRVDAAVLWVHLDADGRPARLPDRFDGIYAVAAGGRTVRARLHHAPRPDGLAGEPFPLRFCDFDVMAHVNNAVSWEPVEQALAARPGLRAPLRVSVEHPLPIEMDAAPEVAVVDRDGRVRPVDQRRRSDVLDAPRSGLAVRAGAASASAGSGPARSGGRRRRDATSSRRHGGGARGGRRSRTRPCGPTSGA